MDGVYSYLKAPKGPLHSVEIKVDNHVNPEIGPISKSMVHRWRTSFRIYQTTMQGLYRKTKCSHFARWKPSASDGWVKQRRLSVWLIEPVAGAIFLIHLSPPQHTHTPRRGLIEKQSSTASCFVTVVFLIDQWIQRCINCKGLKRKDEQSSIHKSTHGRAMGIG